jgi:hypothetical protein
MSKGTPSTQWLVIDQVTASAIQYHRFENDLRSISSKMLSYQSNRSVLVPHLSVADLSNFSYRHPKGIPTLETRRFPCQSEKDQTGDTDAPDPSCLPRHALSPDAPHGCLA